MFHPWKPETIRKHNIARYYERIADYRGSIEQNELRAAKYASDPEFAADWQGAADRSRARLAVLLAEGEPK